MTNDKNIIDEKLHHDINREAVKSQHYHQAKLININIILVRKSYLLIKAKK